MLKIHDNIKNEVEKERDYIISLRRYFHSMPELPREEYETAAKIEEELRSFGLETRRVGETGVYSEIEGKTGGRTLILRSDIDALPVKEEHECSYKSKKDGIMHACGHDGHTASLLASAKILAKHRDCFSGKIKLCFQQAEEIGYGARVFIEEGLVTGDRCFGFHLASNIPVGKISATAGPNNASVDFLRIKIHGKGAHVSTPERGTDALYIASQIVVALQALVTRRTNPTDSVLIGIGKITAGTSYNVVAQEAELEGTIRVMYPEIRERMKKELEDLVFSTARIYGGSADVEYVDFTSPLINPVDTTKEVAKVAREIVGDDNVIENRPYSLGGDDFAEFILKVPGTYAYIGSGNKDRAETLVAHHDSHFDIDEEALVIGSKLEVLYALEYLNGEL